MIRASKFLFSKTTLPPLQNKVLMMFARQKRSLDDLRQMSYIAQIMMRQIAKDRSFGQIKESSLTQHIIKTVEQQRHIKEEIRNEMLKFFKEGIHLDSNTFIQGRHKTQIFFPQKKQDPSQDTRMRYFPTTLISSQVFFELLNNQEPYQILTGHSGISKSLSVQLFWYLSNIICEYRCLEQSKEKLKQNEVLKRVPKLIYWNINTRETAEKARNKILDQFFEVGDNLESSNYLKLGQKDDIIQYYEDRGIDVILLIDQFNLIINLKKEIEELQLQLRENSEDISVKAKLKQTQVMHDNCEVALRNIRKGLYKRYIYLSSLHIEKKLLERYSIKLGAGNQANLEFKRLRFEDFVYTPMACYELIDYFMFEIKQKLNLPSYQEKIYNNEQVKKKIRDQLFEKIRKQSDKFYLTPLLISQNLRTNINEQSVQTLNQAIQNIQQSTENVVHQLKVLFSSCLKHGDQNLRQKVHQFLQKGNKKAKIAILAELFQQSQILKKQNIKLPFTSISVDDKKYSNEQKYMFEADAKRLIGVYNSDEMVIVNQKYEIEKFESLIDKKLFDYDSSTKKIRSYFKYSHIQKYLGQYNDAVIEFLMSYSEQQIKQIHGNNPGGTAFENLFIQCVSSGHFDVIFPYLFSFKNINERRFGFYPIPVFDKMEQDYCFVNEFINKLEKLPRQTKTYTFVPIFREKDNRQQLNEQKLIYLSDIDKHSPDIDLVFVDTNQDQSKPIFLTAFDLTVTPRVDNVQDKFRKFIQRFKLFKDSGEITLNGFKRKVIMKYIVMTACNETQKIKNIFSRIAKKEQFFIDQRRPNRMFVDQNKIKQKGYSPILQQIAHVCMNFEQMRLKPKFDKKNFNHKILWYFDRLVKAMQQLEKKNKQKQKQKQNKNKKRIVKK